MSEMTIKQKQQAIRTSLIISSVMLMPAIIAAIFSNSVTILTDLVQESSDTIAILFSFFAIRKISRGKNLDYNFGYGKLEGFSSLFVAGVILLSLIFVLINTFKGFTEPTAITGFGVWIAVATNLLDGGISLFQWQKLKGLLKGEVSPIIEGQASLYRSGFISSSIVSAGLILAWLLQDFLIGKLIDPIGGLILSIYLGHTVFTLFSSSMDNLMDKTLEETLQIDILRAMALNFEKYDELHDIRSRRSGSDVYIEVYVGFDPETKMGEVMENIQMLRKAILEETGKAHINIIPVTPEMT
jgi:ferrous-iron efflux pump FieF